MIDAAQARLFVAAEEQRRAAMRAVVVRGSRLAVGVAERDQVFAEQPEAEGIAVRRRQLGRQQRGQPEAAEQLAHRRAGPGARQELVVFFASIGP